MKSKTPDVNIRMFTNKYDLPSLLLKANCIDDLLEHDRDALIKIIGAEIVEQIEKIIVMHNETTTENLLDEYYVNHDCCPVCGSNHISQHLEAFLLDKNKPEEFVDKNKAWCSDCKWKGIIHDLVKSKELIEEQQND